jgi:hypothetical protein
VSTKSLNNPHITIDETALNAALSFLYAQGHSVFDPSLAGESAEMMFMSTEEGRAKLPCRKDSCMFGAKKVARSLESERHRVSTFASWSSRAPIGSILARLLTQSVAQVAL